MREMPFDLRVSSLNTSRGIYFPLMHNKAPPAAMQFDSRCFLWTGGRVDAVFYSHLLRPNAVLEKNDPCHLNLLKSEMEVIAFPRCTHR